VFAIILHVNDIWRIRNHYIRSTNPKSGFNEIDDFIFYVVQTSSILSKYYELMYHVTANEINNSI